MFLFSGSGPLHHYVNKHMPAVKKTNCQQRFKVPVFESVLGFMPLCLVLLTHSSIHTSTKHIYNEIILAHYRMVFKIRGCIFILLANESEKKVDASLHSC